MRRRAKPKPGKKKKDKHRKKKKSETESSTEQPKKERQMKGKEVKMTRAELISKTQKDAGNTIGSCISCLAILAGLVMVTLGKTMGEECKMRCIDVSSYNKPGKPGNIPKWFVYTGSIIAICGGLGCLTVGVVPYCLRDYSYNVGGLLADVLSGLGGRIVLMMTYILVALCNLIGYFWYFMAATSRYPENSAEPGDPNYCHPVMWNLLWAIVHGFALVTIMVFVSIGANIHRFFRGDDVNCDTKVDSSGLLIKTPKKKHGGKGGEFGVPV